LGARLHRRADAAPLAPTLFLLPHRRGTEINRFLEVRRCLVR
jgi:hypothetical protein